MRALIWIVGFLLLCIPSLVFGFHDLTAPAYVLRQYPHLTGKWDSHPQAAISGHPLDPGYIFTGALTQSVSIYKLSCGASLTPHPVTAVFMRQQVFHTRIAEFEEGRGYASDKAQVLIDNAAAVNRDGSLTMIPAPKWGGYAVGALDEPTTPYGYATGPSQLQAGPGHSISAQVTNTQESGYCSSRIAKSRITTFMISPVGWAALLIVIFIGLGMFVGTMPDVTIFGGGWTAKIWFWK